MAGTRITVVTKDTGWEGRDARTGKVVWSVGAADFASTPLRTAQGNFVLARTSSAAIDCVTPTGKRLWSVPEFAAVFDPQPIVSDGRTLVYGLGNFIWPATPDEDDYLEQLGRRFVEGRGAGSGSVLWRRPFFTTGVPLGFSQAGSLVLLKSLDAKARMLGRPTSYAIVVGDIRTGAERFEARLPKELNSSKVVDWILGTYPVYRRTRGEIVLDALEEPHQEEVRVKALEDRRFVRLSVGRREYRLQLSRKVD